MSEKRLFEMLAKEHNTTVENVKEEIMLALSYAEDNHPEIWVNMQGTLVEKIQYLANLALSCAV